ncbi:hypothetical protein AwDysgo_13510 [Bacteroidales bacterium]|nr:hypothetical protein AwDysgo_13510 [Bacteroidales bacterium]
MNKIFLKAVIIACTLPILYACSNEDDVVSKAEPKIAYSSYSESYEGVQDPKVVDGMLVFTDFNQVASILSKFHALPEEERLALENNKMQGFISQTTIFGAIEKAELELVDTYNNATSDNERADILNKQFSDLYLKKRASGFIQESVDENGYSSFNYSIFKPYFAPILNENGYYAIGDTVFQITSDAEITWVDGVALPTPLEFKSTSASNSSEYHYNGSYRFLVEYDFSSRPLVVDGTIWRSTLNFNIECQHNSGTYPFKKWKRTYWDVKYFIKRRVVIDYLRMSPPYGEERLFGSELRFPAFGTKDKLVGYEWQNVNLMTESFERPKDSGEIVYVNRVYNNTAKLQPIFNVDLMSLEIEVEFVGRKTINLQKDSNKGW